MPTLCSQAPRSGGILPIHGKLLVQGRSFVAESEVGRRPCDVDVQVSKRRHSLEAQSGDTTVKLQSGEYQV